jgi:hypothetical protein
MGGIPPLKIRWGKGELSFMYYCRIKECMNDSDFKGFERIYFICMFIIFVSSERSTSEGLILLIFAVSHVRRSA